MSEQQAMLQAQHEWALRSILNWLRASRMTVAELKTIHEAAYELGARADACADQAERTRRRNGGLDTLYSVTSDEREIRLRSLATSLSAIADKYGRRMRALLPVVALLFLVVDPAHAATCNSLPRHRGNTYWAYHLVHQQRCWYPVERRVWRSASTRAERTRREARSPAAQTHRHSGSCRVDYDASQSCGAEPSRRHVSSHLTRRLQHAQPPAVRAAETSFDPDGVWPRLDTVAVRWPAAEMPVASRAITEAVRNRIAAMWKVAP